MLAAHAAFIVAAMVLLNIWTAVNLVTAVFPAVHGNIRSVLTPLNGALASIAFWFSVYITVRRVLRADINSGRRQLDEGSSRPVIIYAITSLIIWFVSVAMLTAVNA